MAQAGYTPILIYASGTATNIPTAGNLISGSSGAELAINYADGKLYYKDGSGNVKLLSIGYGSSSVTPTNGGVQYGTGTALALTAAGSSGQILRSNGAAAPTWADLSTLGVNTISFGTTGLTPNSATAGAVTVAGTLVTANGGTGLGGATPFTANGVLYASSASALTSGSALTFDGTSLGVGATTVAARVDIVGGINNQFRLSSSETNATTKEGKFLLRHYTNAQPNFLVMYPYSTSTDNAIFYGGGSSSQTAATFHAWTTAANNTTVSGTERMRLDSSGNLGIGTSSPATKLDVYNSQASGISEIARFRWNNGGSGGAITWANQVGTVLGQIANSSDSNGNPLLFYVYNTSTALTKMMTLDGSGNLGLGVTPSAWSGLKAFQFGNSGAVSSSVNFAGFTANAYFTTSGYGGATYINNGYANMYLQSPLSGQHQWYTAPSGTAGDPITFTQAMTLDASGNLGVGTTSPAYSLDVLKTTDAISGAQISNLSTGSSARAQLLLTSDSVSAQTVATSSANTAAALGGRASTFALFTGSGDSAGGIAMLARNASGYITFHTGGNTERARITSAGELLIGTTSSATSPLSIQAKTSGYSLWSINDATLNYSQFYFGGTATAGFQFIRADGRSGGWLAFGTQDTERARIDSSGNFTIGGQTATRLEVNLSENDKVELNAVDSTNTARNLVFSTGDTERARIDTSGNLLVGQTSTTSPGDGNTTAGTAIQSVGKAYFSCSTGRGLTLNRNEDGAVAGFFRSGTEVGSISVTTSATAYNTSSDYRLKDNQQPLTGSGAFIDALQPKTWNWKADGSRGVGFIAHEVQAVSPGSVVGEKDAVDKEGKPIMQAMEYGSAEFIANIIAELQSLRQRVALLEGN